MMRPLPPFPLRTLAVLATVISLAACGGGGGAEDEEHDHEHTSIDTAGRLAIAETGSATLRMHDLDSGSVAASITLANAPSAVYASPGGRYAVALQRAQDITQIVDGGIWQEDHGDHDHDYKEAPSLLSLRLDGPQPTHYDDREGKAALFMDGRSETTPVRNASALVITDAGIASGKVLATLPLSQPMHGFAEPNGDNLIATWRDPAASGPTKVEVYKRNGTGYDFSQRLDTECPGMHGSYTLGSITMAGCIDGALVVAPQTGGSYSATFVAAPSRISTVAGHPAFPRFIGIGNSGTPSTTRFHDVNPATGAVATITVDGWVEGRLQRAYRFDRKGQLFFVLDDVGTLRVLQPGAGGWATRATLTGAIPSMPSAAPYPAIVANGARDEVYISDPVGKQLVVVDTVTLQVKQRVALGYAPSYLAWVGITR